MRLLLLNGVFNRTGTQTSWHMPFDKKVRTRTCLGTRSIAGDRVGMCGSAGACVGTATGGCCFLGFALVSAMELPVAVFEHIPWVSC